MKYLLIILFVLIGFAASAQPGYTKIPSRYSLIAGKFDSTAHIPAGCGTPSGITSLRGGFQGAGALFIDSCANIMYVWNHGVGWTALSTGVNYGRFGVSGEDDNAGSTARSFNASLTNFTIDSANNLTLQSVRTQDTSHRFLKLSNSAVLPPFELAYDNAETPEGPRSAGVRASVVNNDVDLEFWANRDLARTAIFRLATEDQSFHVLTDTMFISGLQSTSDTVNNKPIVWETNGNNLVRKFTYWPSGGGASSNDSLMVTRNALLHDKPSSTTITDVDGRYRGFPWAVVKKDPALKRDVVWTYLKDGTTHADDGPMRVSKSIDGGKTWIYVGNVKVDAAEISITSLQTGHFGDTTHISYTNDAYDTVFFAKATDGLNFTSTGYVLYKYGWSGSPSINYMYKLVSDTIYAPQYEMDALGGADSSIAFLTYYTGGQWFRGSNVLVQAGLPFPNGRTSEWAVIPYQLGANDATTSLISLHRNEDYGYYTHVKTSDNFATTTEDVTNFMYEFGTQVSKSPARIITIDSTTYIICGSRRNNSPYGLEIVSIPTASFWTNTQASYSKVKRTYVASSYYKAAAEDWGYSMEYFLDNKWWMTSYDVSPENHSASEGSDDDVRSFVMPLFGANYAEVFNDANQSITDSTNTLVSFPDIMLDGLGGFRYDGEANTIDSVFHITEDGWYSFDASGTFTSSMEGSKRKMWILKVDPGVNTSATNIVIAQQTISGNAADADFNRIELHGKEYCRQGEWIKVFAYHDATSALNLTNTSQTIRAKLKITLLK